MNPIFQALNSGYAPKQILAFMAKAFPQLSPQIKKAQAAGYTSEKILGFLSKTVRDDITPGMSETEIHTANKRHDAQLTKSGLKFIGGAIATPIAAQAAGNALQRALPSSLRQFGQQPGIQPGPSTPPAPGSITQPQGPQQQLPQAGNNATQAAQSLQPPINPQVNQPQAAQGVQAPQSTNITQTSQESQPIQPQRDVNKSVDIIKNSGKEESIKNMLSSGMAPKDIKTALEFIIGKKKLNDLEKASGGIEQAIEDYASTIQQEEPEQPQEITQDMNEEETTSELKEPEPGSFRGKQLVAEKKAIEEAKEMKEEEKPQPIAKNSTVSTPQGIGEVKEIRNGKAIVEVDGKKHQVDESELEKPAFTEDEIADAYDRLMKVIPEEHKSGFISWAGYDEDRRVLGYIPRGGKYEELSDITPEEAELIKTGKGVARTGGENREGFWAVGGDTRGLISQIQHDRRRKREAIDKKQLRLFEEPKREKEDKGMKPIFDEMAHARGLSKARDKKAADEARAKKKAEKEREKNEAKKRKK